LPSVREVDVFGFFFQAEDGIRDKLVTGVQTCALPILIDVPPTGAGALRVSVPFMVRVSPTVGESNAIDMRGTDTITVAMPGLNRSEERRVGKECRAWGERG